MLLTFPHVPSDVITDVIRIWSVFRKLCLFIKNFVTTRAGRLTSDDRSLIWNLHTQKGWSSWHMMKEFPHVESLVTVLLQIFF